MSYTKNRSLEFWGSPGWFEPVEVAHTPDRPAQADCGISGGTPEAGATVDLVAGLTCGSCRAVAVVDGRCRKCGWREEPEA